MTHRPAAPARTPLTRRRVLTTTAAAAGALALPGTSALAVPTSFEAETRTGRRAPGAVTDPSVVIRWNQAAMDAILGRYQAAGNRFGPATVNARALAIVHNAIYDAWACYDRHAVGTRFGGSLRRPRAERTLDNKNEAISYAAHLALLDLYPEYKVAIDSMLRSLGGDPELTDPRPYSPAWIGLRTPAPSSRTGTPTAPTSSAPPPTPTPPATSRATARRPAAEFLRRFTGSDSLGDSHRCKAGTSTDEPCRTPHTDVVLHWPTRSQAAHQAGVPSYGGMHWSFDNEPGIETGRLRRPRPRRRRRLRPLPLGGRRRRRTQRRPDAAPAGRPRARRRHRRPRRPPGPRAPALPRPARRRQRPARPRGPARLPARRDRQVPDVLVVTPAPRPPTPSTELP
ncbi:hypothetical protein STANM309S_03852 [Streptomyces tanashiensis]